MGPIFGPMPKGHRSKPCKGLKWPFGPFWTQKWVASATIFDPNMGLSARPKYMALLGPYLGPIGEIPI